MEAIVAGRLSADIYPEQIETPLEDVETFRRYVGGFAGNVCTGLARLGVDCAIVSAVGDDGHGRFVRRALEAEGVDTRWLGTHDTLRTALAFCEIWPPDTFPITFYRTPTCPDWELRPEDVDAAAFAEAPLVYASGTGLAVEPSRSTTLGLLAARAGRPHTILDLDWREALWRSRDEYAAAIADALPHASVVLGGDGEYAAAGVDPAEPRPAARVVKHGPDGCTVFDTEGEHRVAGLQVEVVNGLGAGDAFAAAWGYGLIRGLEPAPLANAAGAIVATRHSCSTAMPTEDELTRFLVEHR
ncbi:MAG TPA: PfkB family carbohydrate kinase [Gaiellaceae bacterium]|jgi:5-dehydro-2-deoxygluconokinase